MDLIRYSIYYLCTEYLLHTVVLDSYHANLVFVYELLSLPMYKYYRLDNIIGSAKSQSTPCRIVWNGTNQGTCQAENLFLQIVYFFQLSHTRVGLYLPVFMGMLA